MYLLASIDNAEKLYLKLIGYSDRRQTQATRYNILTDNTEEYIKKEITEKFDIKNAEDLYKHLDLSNNSYKYIIRLLSIVYKQPPVRSFSNPADNELFDLVVNVPELDTLMEQINKLTMALNECLVLITTRSEMIDYDIILPQNCEVESTGTKLNAIIYKLSDGTFAYWDNESVIYLDLEGHLISSEPNPYGFIPVVTYRREYPINSFWLGKSGDDLVECYREQTIYRSYLNRISYYQSFQQIVRNESELGGLGDAAGVTKRNQTLGPQTYLEGDFSTLDLKTDITGYYSVIEGKLQRTAANWGISPDIIGQRTQITSIRNLLAQSSLLEHRRSLIKHFRPSDLALMTMTANVWNIEGTSFTFDNPANATIDYQEPQLVESKKDELEALEKEIGMGLASPVDYIMKEDPDIISREKAIEKIQSNLEEWRLVSEYKRSFQIPENNDIEQKTLEGMQGGRPETNNTNPLTSELDNDES